ncbi:MerR family transcriptional regulator [Flavihumibacter rivuli]|uniref:MerR family transcriptional regulator n=1 Tax=Flavihumibacter rivuli TaxID=2838156 RepID=UPI001BDE0E0E|nr:MerR family transcriptional regulator [Flavihumibacter rivuli]ULQ57517.1 MerR family transcriptional regulator [Flavihumibacter rivuli]
MHHFTISDIEQLTGIKAHTIRVWEQRYSICTGKRKESGHRFYDDEDLKKILRLAYLYHNGVKISALAEMKEDELSSVALSLSPQGQFDVFINQLLEVTQTFDQYNFEKLLHMIILHLGFEKTILEVVYPYLERIGLLWLTDNAIPAQEHFASNLIQKKLIVAIDGLDAPPPGAKRIILLFTPPGEAHELPLLFMHYLMKKNGNRVIYLGKEVPVEVIEAFTRRFEVTHLYFHLITHLQETDPAGYIRSLVTAFPAIKITGSGPALAKMDDQPAGFSLLSSMSAMLKFAKAS